MQNKSVYILIVKFFFLCAVLFFSAVGFARTSDFRFAIIMGFALILALIDYMSKVVSNKKNYQELLINNERIKKMEAELDSLHEVSKVITSTFDVKVIMEHTYNELVRITRCEWYYVCLLTKNLLSRRLTMSLAIKY